MSLDLGQALVTVILYFTLYGIVIYNISKVTKAINDKTNVVLEEMSKQSELLKEQNDLLKKILTESSDEEKKELNKKLQQVSEILNN